MSLEALPHPGAEPLPEAVTDFQILSSCPQIRLKVNPSRWATYSLIRLRETDKGPWRVEISDERNNLLGTVRFSITD
ncbi:DUF2914 domain-containing protein [Desulfoglaeba alkanexedens]|jgi:hypothetical protein|uniref:DUF2914 domain-containing protein n=1 Tax=Desulfoglaeba alkanexedens ALDC TaxID=980445 RepID=A0A4P8L644_9BACT|nr:DUF2914 domain-containing protein [Desulfoglaeba alkanexedens]QCQ22565.1 DUF2914 domain-containing protein [Desulfoglaeba alkanexedens ALDC]